MRLVPATILALALLLVELPAADASQAELDRARRRADAAAAEWARSETQLSRVQTELRDLEAQAAATKEELAGLESAVRAVAVDRFMRGGRRVVSVDLDPSDASASNRASALAGMVTARANADVDAYRAAAEDLQLAEERLARAREEAEALRARSKRNAAATNAELQRLEKLEAERIAREREVRRRAAEAAASARRTSARPARAGAARPAAAPRSGPAVIGSGEWICPVQGPRAFTNDWGNPRSGGRRHQGTDIMSPRGTPVVAPVAGTARVHNSSLGGLSFYLNGVDGHTYFGTHLDSTTGRTGRVAAGTVLGYVGNSGNARGGATHLHFEIHPGGGSPANPYPTLRQYC